MFSRKALKKQMYSVFLALLVVAMILSACAGADTGGAGGESPDMGGETIEEPVAPEEATPMVPEEPVAPEEPAPTE